MVQTLTKVSLHKMYNLSLDAPAGSIKSRLYVKVGYI